MNRIQVETRVNAPVSAVWRACTTPADIKQLNNASDDWHTPHAEVDLRPGGRFLSRMEARDGSSGFDFEGTYTRVEPKSHIAYNFGDRTAVERFVPDGDATVANVAFDPEDTHSIEMQQQGWQSILDNFKRHVETAR